MVRLRIPFGLMAATIFTTALALPASSSHAATASTEAARKQATERLFNAVHANDYTAVQSSVGAGADVDAVNSWGLTAADLAVDKGYFRIAHYLVSVRNFQRKGEQTSASTPAITPTTTGTPTAVTPEATPRAAAVSAPPTKTAASPTALAPSKVAPAASTPVAAPAAVATTVTSSAIDTSAPSGAPDPFSPNAPAYGAQVPAASN